MGWFAQSLILVVLIAVAVSVITRLLNRIGHLEQRLEQLVDSHSAELLAFVNHMGAAILRPGPDEAEHLKADSVYEASKIIEEIGSRLSRHIPALRRVLTVSIGVSLEFLREKTGITSEELEGVKGRLAPMVLWPASSMVIEEWSTHTVINDFSGRPSAIYPDWTPSFEPRVIWRHVLPETRNFDKGGALELVLHEGVLKFWARQGQFGVKFWSGESEDEYLFASVPMSEEGLCKYRIADEPSEDPETRIAQEAWIRHYGSGSLEEGVAWAVTINDVLAYATR